MVTIIAENIKKKPHQFDMKLSGFIGYRDGTVQGININTFLGQISSV